MTLGHDRLLYLVAFDHRHSFSKGLFHADEPLSEEVKGRVADTKQLIFEGFEQAIARGAPKPFCGLLVDEEFGAGVARRAKAGGYALAMPVERSGRAEFDFEYGEEFPRHIESFDPDFTKVLVRYNPEGDRELNRRQTARLARLSSWLHARGRKFLFELLVPPTQEQLARCGSQERYDAELHGALVVQVLRELQQGGVEPDIWKIEGLDSAEDCVRVVAQARTGADRKEVVCIVLGRGASMEQVRRWLTTAAPVPGFAGFAVGRTLWEEALKRFIAGAESREETAHEIADRYLGTMQEYFEATQTIRMAEFAVEESHPG